MVGQGPDRRRRESGWPVSGARTPHVLIPVKRLTRAKSRLSLSVDCHRGELALAFAVDTALTAAAVTTVTVVCDDPRVRAVMTDLSIEVITDGAATGLNEAIGHATASFGTTHVAVLTSDLPALRGPELADALTATTTKPRSFVADADGTGTVLLAGRADALRSAFGTDSARAHRRAGFIELVGRWPGLRRDVDTADNLADATMLGLGAHTARLLADTGYSVRVLTHVRLPGHRGRIRPGNPQRLGPE